MIVIVGFMGAGKSTVGCLLAGKLGLPFADIDEVIEQRTGCLVREIFETGGEPAFRALEHEITTELLAGPDAVLALGGGAVQHPATRQSLLGASHVIYLQVGFAEAMSRVGPDEGRPVLRAPDLPAVFRRRLASYEAVATQTVATGGRLPEEVCLDIMGRLADLPG
jgi:shikimate kinase